MKSIYEIYQCKDKEELYKKVKENDVTVKSLVDFIEYTKIPNREKPITDANIFLKSVSNFKPPTKEIAGLLFVDTKNYPTFYKQIDIHNRLELKNTIADALISGSNGFFMSVNDDLFKRTAEDIQESIQSVGLKHFDTAIYKDISNTYSSEKDVFTSLSVNKNNEDIKIKEDSYIYKSEDLDISNSIYYEEFQEYYIEQELKGKNVLKDTDEIKNTLRKSLQSHKREVVGYVKYDKENKIIGTHQLFKGGLNLSVVDKKVLFADLLSDKKVKGFFMYHNHPSGIIEPSREDIYITNGVIKASKMLDIEIADHLIVGKSGVYSFRDNDYDFSYITEETNSIKENTMEYGNNNTRSQEDVKNIVSDLINDNHEEFIKSLISIEKNITDENLLNDLYLNYMEQDDIGLLNDFFDIEDQEYEFDLNQENNKEYKKLKDSLMNEWEIQNTNKDIIRLEDINDFGNAHYDEINNSISYGENNEIQFISKDDAEWWQEFYISLHVIDEARDEIQKFSYDGSIEDYNQKLYESRDRIERFNELIFNNINELDDYISIADDLDNIISSVDDFTYSDYSLDDNSVKESSNRYKVEISENSIRRGDLYNSKMNENTVVIDYNKKLNTAILLATPTFIYAKNVELNNNSISWQKGEYFTNLNDLNNYKNSFEKFMNTLRPLNQDLLSLKGQQIKSDELQPLIESKIEPKIPLIFQQESNKVNVSSAIHDSKEKPKFEINLNVDRIGNEIKINSVEFINNNMKDVFLDDIDLKNLEKNGFTVDVIKENIEKTGTKIETTKDGKMYIPNENIFKNLQKTAFDIRDIDNIINNPKIPENKRRVVKAKLEYARETKDLNQIKKTKEIADKVKETNRKEKESVR